MKTLKVLSMIDGQPTFDKNITEFLNQCEPGSVIQLLTPEEYLCTTDVLLNILIDLHEFIVRGNVETRPLFE